MQAEKASELLAERAAWPAACAGELVLELEQAVVTPATEATATASRASSRALRARRSSAPVRVDPGLCMGLPP